MTTPTLPLRNSVNRSPVRLAFLLIPLACFALSRQAEAVCKNNCDTSNGNTYLGDDALISNTTGDYNTAIGFEALEGNTTGAGNTATGLTALAMNTTGSLNTASGVAALRYNTTGR